MEPRRRSRANALVAVLVAVGSVLLVVGTGSAAAARRGAVDTGPTVSWTLTRGDGRALLTPQAPVRFGADQVVSGAVVVDPQATGQRVVGVGAAMTESSAYLLRSLPPAERTEALRTMFDPVTGAGASVVRVPIGASDFALDDYTYDDVPTGRTDEELTSFSIERDERHVLPVLREALAVNPGIQLVLAAWSPPAWMKTTGTTHGGALLPEYEPIYARYLARTVQAFTAGGFRVRALSVVNEPGHSTPSYPTTAMSLDQQERVATRLRQELDAVGLAQVGVLAHDHNWDGAGTAVAALTGDAAGAYTGAAFHCYGGDVSAQSQVALAAPGKEVWTTECSGGGWSSGFADDLRWGARSMLVGAFRNGSVATLWWNLALDPDGGPTNGGCADCRGVLTVDPSRATTTRNVEYYSLAHVGRFVPRGSVRIGTPARNAAGIESVAFRTPTGGTVLVLLNDAPAKRVVTVRWEGRSATLPMPAQSVATATW